jgi:hypothetical protein
MAERNGIGKDTYLYVMQPGTIGSQCGPGLISDIRKAWDSAGAPRVPPGILDIIDKADIHTL